MRLPRWTVYPALALLAGMIVVAVPARRVDPFARPPVSEKSEHPRVVVLGIDGMDPDILRETIDRFPGSMTNFARLATEGGIHALRSSNPPQSPVAWSNFITGRRPGGHGVFDFIHRDPMTRRPIPGTTRSTHGSELSLGEWVLPLGGGDESNRSGVAFWTVLAEHGVPADVWRVPANFPIEPALGLSFSGMFTPAIDSAYGKFSFFTTDPPTDSRMTEEKIVAVTERDGRIFTRLEGPSNPFREGHSACTVPLTILIDHEAQAAAIDLDGQVIVIEPGEWSEFVRVDFSPLPMSLADVGGIVRFYLRSLEPEFELYCSPVNIDPSAPFAPVSEPTDASADLADASQGGIGLYYTQGMAEDVNAHKCEMISVPEFAAQTDLVHDENVRMMDWALDHYLAKREGGFFFYYYSSVDLCCHMLWRHSDAAHPGHDAAFAAQDSSSWSKRAGSTWKDAVADLYLRMDPVLGRLRERLPSDATLIVMSDHGFAPFRRKFNLNTWLFENGYLVLQDGQGKELAPDDPAHQQVMVTAAADWSRTRAYGIGFQALYLNLEGRELDLPTTPQSEAGIVRASEAEALIEELAGKLEALVDVNGERPILRCDRGRVVYSGERAHEAPDLVIQYNAGYGNSDEATLGRVTHAVLEDNRGGSFNGSHLMAPEVVPGLLMTTGRLRAGEHGLEDLTVEILKQYGIAPAAGMVGAPVLE